MPTATLVPDSLTDSNSNVAAGAYTDIDTTIAAASGATLDSVTDGWTGGVGTGSAFTFTLSDLPATATSINTVQFRVRARVTGTDAAIEVKDLWQITCDVSGDNAPTTTAKFDSFDVGDGFMNLGASAPVTSSATVAEINAWSVRVYQNKWTQISTADGLNIEIDEIEIAVDYNTAPPDPPSDPPTGGSYTVIPTTDTSIYGMTISRVRDFVVLGGLDADRYSIRWSAITDPTDWPTPATDDARSKQSGSQSFPTEFGQVTAVSSGDFYFYVFQERAVTKATYVGGDVVFSFDTFEEDRGCVRQGRIAQIDDRIFFQSSRGYHSLINDQITDIGFGKVDDSYN